MPLNKAQNNWIQKIMQEKRKRKRINESLTSWEGQECECGISHAITCSGDSERFFFYNSMSADHMGKDWKTNFVVQIFMSVSKDKAEADTKMSKLKERKKGKKRSRTWLEGNWSWRTTWCDVLILRNRETISAKMMYFVEKKIKQN